MDASVQQALIDRAVELRNASDRLHQSAEKVRIAQILNQLVALLHQQENHEDSILLKSALLVARLDNPDFHPAHYLKRVDRMAERIAQNIPPSATQREKLDILIDQMFREYGYHGSTLDFHHRANSYVNEVIDDREGLPITLSLLFLELGNRIDLPLFGLATPGHFLALYREPGQGIEESVLIDAFGGQTISRQQANELTNFELTDEDLLPATEIQIISRILRNLLKSAEWDRDSLASLRYLEALVAINPQDQYLRTLRAMTLYGEGMFAEALSEINYLIEQDPDNASKGALLEIRRRLSDPH
ncbi:MAG: transglutaminase-like domain-containing protein [Opitutae bacterium]